MPRQNQKHPDRDRFILFQDDIGRPVKGRVRQIYPSGNYRVWRLSDGHNIIIKPAQIIRWLEEFEY